MITLQLSSKSFWETTAEGYIFLLKDGLQPASPQASLDLIKKEFYPHLNDIFKSHKFEGKRGQSLVLSGLRNDKLLHFIFIGLGKMDRAWHVELDGLRRGLTTAISHLKKLSLNESVVALPEGKNYNISDAELFKQMATACHMGSYDFVAYKTDKKDGAWNGKLLFAATTADDIKTSFDQGNIVGLAANNARHWADSPANLMTPTTLSQEAKKIADKHKLPCTIFGREKALELGMGAFCSVDGGSDQDGKFVILEYKTTTLNAPTIALCGKGIMFDTGGINIKPSAGMYSMKYDMSGAAAVITVMDIIAQLKPAINVIGLTPLVENMPSGKASRPSDIVTAMNGKTIEIKDTDAEGRLVLSDTLCYAEKFYNPDIIIDIATLTGAVQHALGHFYSGLMSKDQALVDRLLEVANVTGDRTWQLPMDDDFKDAIRSDFADIHNAGNPAYFAGTIIGATFLSNFVSKARWAHLDIGGTAHDVVGVNYVGKGGSGAGIRLLSEFLMTFKG